jgi:hypothetical protein
MHLFIYQGGPTAHKQLFVKGPAAPSILLFASKTWSKSRERRSLGRIPKFSAISHGKRMFLKVLFTAALLSPSPELNIGAVLALVQRIG